MKADFEFDKYITEALTEEPGFFLPADFADKMTEKIRRRHSLRESLKEYSVYAALFLGLAIFVCGFLLFINKDNLSQLQAFVTGNLTEIILLVFIANFILFADKVLLRILFTFKQR
jgi:hypothetical protein